MSDYFKFLGLGFVSVLAIATAIYIMTFLITGEPASILYTYGVSVMVYIVTSIMLMISNK